MSETPIVKLVQEQEWLNPLGQKSDELVATALKAAGDAGAATRDVLINSRILGHKRHPTITDVPFGAWSVTLVADVLELSGNGQFSRSGDLSLLIGLAASGLAATGGLADLSETRGNIDRKLGMMHGIFHGVTMLLYGGSWLTRKSGKRSAGRVLSLAGYAGLLAAASLANQLAERRQATQ